MRAMGRWTRALPAHDLLAPNGATGPGLRRPFRLLGAALVLLSVAALAAWLAHAVLDPVDAGWPARLIETVAGWLRAAWTAGP
jgi:hypothetical protein